MNTVKRFRAASSLRSAMVAAIIALCCVPGASPGFAASPEADVHDRIFTLDSHVDIPFNYTETPETDPGKATDMQVDLGKMDKGGLDSGFFIVYVGQTERTPENYAKAKADALQKFSLIHRMTDQFYPDRIGMAYHPADVEKIAASGRKVAMIGIENGFVIGKDLSLLRKYYDLGGRYMTLAHMGHNDICDTSTPNAELGDGPEEHGGLSAFGREVIDEMNRLGMMVDVSHISEKSMRQAVAYSKAPVIASHSSVRALADHPRNLTDDQMRLLAKHGGVMQIVALSAYIKVDPARHAAYDALEQKVAALYKDDNLDEDALYETPEMKQGLEQLDRDHPPATVSQFVDHIDHAVKVMGVDHVGISSDFGGGGGITGWNNAAETGNITRELLARGYSEEDIAKIWSGNLLRVWRDVEAVAGKSAN
ncbi:dipeptidase [Emcibacter nanhaiensis]|uniref:Membrane dipeptidase n=1 Tax=Emcibacter nanhaiensis TaxID=1505037 RepID=A0A501PNN5_9PROT|nr:dipeptidase [Emcibacter nanhaiensis]TPD61885.1 membrane dipeptidase [Emcibacter nanhaiensis]